MITDAQIEAEAERLVAAARAKAQAGDLADSGIDVPAGVSVTSDLLGEKQYFAVALWQPGEPRVYTDRVGRILDDLVGEWRDLLRALATGWPGDRFVRVDGAGASGGPRPDRGQQGSTGGTQ